MKSRLRQLLVVLIMIGGPSCGFALAQKRGTEANQQRLDSVEVKINIYPANADADQEIKEALVLATKTHKRVLLIFGANWCYDCHVLDRALHEGNAGKIARESYLLVHVDIGEGEKNPELVKAYRIPIEKGVPAVAVLDPAGKLLYSSGDGEFESARTMFKRDLVAFLNKWKPKPRNGSSGLTQAPNPGDSTGDLEFVGTVTEINSNSSDRLRHWVIVTHVDRVTSGTFSGSTFMFTVHSPALSGLEVGRSYTIKAKWTGDAYLVDQYQWSVANRERK